MMSQYHMSEYKVFKRLTNNHGLVITVRVGVLPDGENALVRDDASVVRLLMFMHQTG
jgi:hypothetical protein